MRSMQRLGFTIRSNVCILINWMRFPYQCPCQTCRNEVHGEGGGAVVREGASFLAHLSQRLKWAFLIKICPLSVVVVVVVVVVGVAVNFSHFHLLLQNHWANFNQTWHKLKHPWAKGIQVCSNEGPYPFPRGDYFEIAKLNLGNLRIFFSRTTGFQCF